MTPALHVRQDTRRRRGGQVMFMLTFALFALCGIMGLAVDLGWSFFVRKAAQSAADAAAMAAVREAMRFGIPGGFTCGSVSGVYCSTTTLDCGSVISGGGTFGNLVSGCQYASTNGFTTNGHNNRQAVSIQSNDNTSLPPTAPGVTDIRYWVTVSITETVPQMFSAVLGNRYGQVTARATAGAVQTLVPGSFYSLNREGDCMGSGNCGVDVKLGGGNHLVAPRGLFMASSCSGNGSLTGCDAEAGVHNGGASVTAPTILIRGTGTADSNSAFPGWANGGTGSRYLDPTNGRTQPPVVATDPVKTCGILNGVINHDSVLGPYNYYAYQLNNKGQQVPTGAPIQMQANNVQFSPTGTCPGTLSLTGAAQTSTFPAYFFYGGLLSDNNTNVTFGSGQYVVVGALANGNNAGTIFDSGGGHASMATAAGASNMFIFTAPTQTAYPGLSTQLNIPEIQLATQNLYQGEINLKAGNSSAFDLHGYEKGDGPSTLDDFNGILMWQDRRNSTVKYNTDGTYGCSGPDYVSGCTKNAGELLNDRVKSGSNSMTIDAGANFGPGMNGVLYQPRGAYMTMQGHGDIQGGLQIITGAVSIQGGGGISLSNPTNPLLQFVTALIE